MSGIRATIPTNVRKTIQNIREIAGNHSDDEIYAMLKECSMDPNETAQKLLLQDTFHEVRRKRDRRKENLNTKEPSESRWRPGMQGRGSRGGRGNYSSRYLSHDAGGGMNANAGKENGVSQRTDKGTTTSSPVSLDTETKASTTNPVTVMANGSTNAGDDMPTHGRESHVPGPSGVAALKNSSSIDVNQIGTTQVLPANMKNNYPSVIGGACEQLAVGLPSLEQFSSMTPASVSGVYSSASDPVLVPFTDSCIPGVVGTIIREVGNQQTAVEPIIAVHAESKPVSQEFTNHMQISKFVTQEVADLSINEVDSEVENLFVHGKVPNKFQGTERSMPPETSQVRPSSSHAGSSASRPSSNYGNRSQAMGNQKVGPSKEWKPKPTNPNAVQAASTVGTSDVPILVGPSTQSLTVPSSIAAEEATAKLQKKLEELHFSDGQNVIIPNHLQVPEAERTGFSFGSFDASFGVSTSFANGLDNDKIATPLSESSQEIEETADVPSSSTENASTAQEGDYPDHPQSPAHVAENLSPGEADVPSSISPGPEYEQPKSETVLPPGGPQYSVVHTNPNHSAFGLMPPILGSQFSPFENSEPQARDGSRVPSFVVQQPFDPSASYYTQLYRPNTDGDGRFSPFVAPGAATKYNGNTTVLPSQSTPSSQESGNSLVLSIAGPTPLGTQATGVMQSSIAVTQQAVPVFRQPAGLHMSHYPPNYIPYGQYFPPFYAPPAIHHFLSNTAFPQQPQPSGVYQPSAAASTVKFSLSHYKPGTNTGNSSHIGIPTGYGPYTSAPAAYNPSPAATTGNSAGSEELSGSQYKENDVYITGQQSESPTVWIPALGRDISALRASSFYSLPPQGQHVTFPTQAGHGAFTGIYHPTQTIAAATVHPLLQQSQTMPGPVEIMGPPTGIFQQPQRPQVNWANNY